MPNFMDEHRNCDYEKQELSKQLDAKILENVALENRIAELEALNRGHLEAAAIAAVERDRAIRERDEARRDLELLELSTRWVSAKERLPEEYHTVLIWREGIPREVGAITAFWTGEKWCKDVMKEDFAVTHWRELPAPPETREVSDGNWHS